MSLHLLGAVSVDDVDDDFEGGDLSNEYGEGDFGDEETDAIDEGTEETDGDLYEDLVDEGERVDEGGEGGEGDEGEYAEDAGAAGDEATAKGGGGGGGGPAAPGGAETAPSDAELEAAIRDAEASAAAAEAKMQAALRKIGEQASEKLLAGRFKFAVGAVSEAERAAAAGRRVSDLGRRAIRAGKRALGERALRAGARAARAGRDLASAIARGVDGRAGRGDLKGSRGGAAKDLRAGLRSSARGKAGLKGVKGGSKIPASGALRGGAARVVRGGLHMLGVVQPGVFQQTLSPELKARQKEIDDAMLRDIRGVLAVQPVDYAAAAKLLAMGQRAVSRAISAYDELHEQSSWLREVPQMGTSARNTKAKLDQHQREIDVGLDAAVRKSDGRGAGLYPRADDLKQQVIVAFRDYNAALESSLFFDEKAGFWRQVGEELGDVLSTVGKVLDDVAGAFAKKVHLPWWLWTLGAVSALGLAGYFAWPFVGPIVGPPVLRLLARMRRRPASLKDGTRLVKVADLRSMMGGR